MRQLWPQARNVREQLLTRGVDLYADAVDAGDDDIVEAAFERRFVDVVLILTDADRLGINLDQFGQRVHETAANGYRTAHR